MLFARAKQLQFQHKLINHNFYPLLLISPWLTLCSVLVIDATERATSTFMVTKDDTRTALIKSAGCFRVLVLDSNREVLCFKFLLVLTMSMQKKRWSQVWHFFMHTLNAPKWLYTSRSIFHRLTSDPFSLSYTVTLQFIPHFNPSLLLTTFNMPPFLHWSASNFASVCLRVESSAVTSQKHQAKRGELR